MAEFIPAAAPNFLVGRGGHIINKIILHTTVGTMNATIATFQNPNRIASAHYVVGLDGRVVQMVREGNTAFHAGNFLVNQESIGIEHVDDGNYNGPRTPALYAASQQLVADICTRYSIPIDRAHLRKHSEVSDKPTACPDALDVQLIVNGAAALRFGGGSGSLEGDDDMLYVGPWVAKTATLKVFAAGSAYLDPSVKARVSGPLAVGSSVGMDGYRFSDSPVQSTDRGAGAGAGPDYVWWHATSGQWVPDAILDTSSVAGALIGAAVSSLPKLSNYFAVAGSVGPAGPDDDSQYATKTELQAVKDALPTKASGNITLTLGQ